MSKLTRAGYSRILRLLSRTHLVGRKRCASLCESKRCCMQVLIMGGADDTGEGLPYSQRLSNLGPGQTPSWTLEPMQGQPRIEGVGVLLPDGTVFLCSGAEAGARPLVASYHCHYNHYCYNVNVQVRQLRL